MGLFADLTKAEKDAVNAFTNALRGFQGGFSGSLHEAQVIADGYDSGVGTIIEGLDPGEELRNEGGLDGAQKLDLPADMANLIADARSFLATYDVDAKRQLRVKAAGINATLNG